MVQLIQPVKVITQQGEATVHITLELNINLNTGGLSLSAPAAEEEKTKWEIPEFKPAKKIEFGKNV